MGDFDTGQADVCDDCLIDPPPWNWGRAALIYKGETRKLILAFKHGDRQEIAIPAGYWMAQRITSLVDPDTVLCPIHLHWRRKLSRRYNQAELLAREVGRNLNLGVRTDLLSRPRHTIPLEHASYEERHDRLANAFEVKVSAPPRSVVLVDDVMTSGATLRVAAQCLSNAGVTDVNIVVLARVDRND